MNNITQHDKPKGMNTLITIAFLIVFCTVNATLLQNPKGGTTISTDTFFYGCNALLFAVTLFAFIYVNFTNNSKND